MNKSIYKKQTIGERQTLKAPGDTPLNENSKTLSGQVHKKEEESFSWRLYPEAGATGKGEPMGPPSGVIGGKPLNVTAGGSGGKPNPESSAQQQQRTKKMQYHERRRAAFILTRANPAMEADPEQAGLIKWAKGILPDFQLAKAGKAAAPNAPQASADAGRSAAKRQRSAELQPQQPKRSKVQPQRSFAEVTTGKILIGVVDEGSSDGQIPRDQWRWIVGELHNRFVEELLASGGALPRCEDAGWHQGGVKVIACEDADSVTFYKRAIAGLGEVYPGAKLVAVDWDKIRSKPRARVWLSYKPAEPAKILKLLQLSNPDFPSSDWRVAKVEEAVGPRRQVVLILNEGSAEVLKKNGGLLRYGFESVAVHVYKSDAKRGVSEVDPDIEGPRIEEAPEGLSDDEDIFKAYASEESELARGLRAVGMSEDADVTVVEVKVENVGDVPANQPPQQ